MNQGFRERGHSRGGSPYMRSPKNCWHSGKWRIRDLDGGSLMGAPSGIKDDLTPTKVGAEMRKFDIPNAVDSIKTHSVMQNATAAPRVPCMCRQYGEKI